MDVVCHTAADLLSTAYLFQEHELGSVGVPNSRFLNWTGSASFSLARFDVMFAGRPQISASLGFSLLFCYCCILARRMLREESLCTKDTTGIEKCSESKAVAGEFNCGRVRLRISAWHTIVRINRVSDSCARQASEFGWLQMIEVLKWLSMRCLEQKKEVWICR